MPSAPCQHLAEGSFKSENTLPFLALLKFHLSLKEGFILKISESYLVIKVNYH